MSLRFLPELAAYQIIPPGEKDRTAATTRTSQALGRRSTATLPDVTPAEFYELSQDEPGVRIAVSRRQYNFGKPRLLKGFEDYGKLMSLTVEDRASERLTAFGNDKWTRDGSALRQIIIAKNQDGLSGSTFNKYCSQSDPTSITTSAPLWHDGSNLEYTLEFEGGPVPVLIYAKEPFSGFSVVGEPFKGRMRQAAVSTIIRTIPPKRADRTTIAFVNEAGLFSPGYRPRLSSGVELNLSMLKLHADGSIAAYKEVGAG